MRIWTDNGPKALPNKIRKKNIFLFSKKSFQLINLLTVEQKKKCTGTFIFNGFVTNFSITNIAGTEKEKRK